MWPGTVRSAHHLPATPMVSIRCVAGRLPFDSTTDDRPAKIVSIVAEHTRKCLGGPVERSMTRDRLIDEPDRLAQNCGYPAVLRCDNGPELATAMADRTQRTGSRWIVGSAVRLPRTCEVPLRH
jgi:hypothetical protein